MALAFSNLAIALIAALGFLVAVAGLVLTADSFIPAFSEAADGPAHRARSLVIVAGLSEAVAGAISVGGGLGGGLVSPSEEIGAVALDLGGRPLHVGAAVLKLSESVVAVCEPIAGRSLVSEGRLLMTGRRLLVP